MKRLALTIGDPTGIGPEITIKALQRLDELSAVKLDIIGNLDVLLKTANDISLALPNNDQVTYHDITVEHPGHVAYQSIETAINMVAAGVADAIVTGPISKKNLMDAGHAAHGHTEILESLAQRLFRNAVRPSKIQAITVDAAYSVVRGSRRSVKTGSSGASVKIADHLSAAQS